jgi:DEAD/DEAH box helicase domain-containing protein
VTAEEAAQEGALLGLEEQPADPVTLWAAAPKSAVQALRDDPEQALREAMVALHLDDSDERQGESFEATWNGFLRLYNLFQFLSGAYPVSADEKAFWGYEELIGQRHSPDSSDQSQPGASDGFDEEAWEQVLEYALDDVQPLLEPLREAQMPPPDVPSYELRRNGQIVAEAELGWPNRKVAVMLPGQTAHKDIFEEQGWSVYEAADLNDDPQELVDALSG